MKKFLACLMAAAFLFSATACGSKGNDVTYASSKDVLNTVVETKELAFPAIGGTFENPVENGAGQLDVEAIDQLDMVALGEEQSKDIADASNLIHAMNGNLFTAAAFKLNDGVDVKAFATAYEEGIKNRQWLCGAPSIVLVIDAGDNYVVTIYGDQEVVAEFKDTALESLKGSEVLVEESLEI